MAVMAVMTSMMQRRHQQQQERPSRTQQTTHCHTSVAFSRATSPSSRFLLLFGFLSSSSHFVFFPSLFFSFSVLAFLLSFLISPMIPCFFCSPFFSLFTILLLPVSIASPSSLCSWSLESSPSFASYFLFLLQEQHHCLDDLLLRHLLHVLCTTACAGLALPT